MDAKKTGELIARSRKEQGLSQGELAERLHVTDKAVSKWETGRGMPGIDSLEPLAEALGLSVSELLSGQRLTAEELPKAAGGQIVESMRRGWKMALKGCGAAVLTLALAAGAYLAVHWFASAPETDLTALAKKAESIWAAGDPAVLCRSWRRNAGGITWRPCVLTARETGACASMSGTACFRTAGTPAAENPL